MLLRSEQPVGPARPGTSQSAIIKFIVTSYFMRLLMTASHILVCQCDTENDSWDHIPQQARVRMSVCVR